jgi:hypothetical protein
MEDDSAHPTTSNTALNEDLIEAMADLLKDLYWTSTSLRLHLVNAIYSKLELNRRKYPVELCKVGWVGIYVGPMTPSGYVVLPQLLLLMLMRTCTPS